MPEDPDYYPEPDDPMLAELLLGAWACLMVLLLIAGLRYAGYRVPVWALWLSTQLLRLLAAAPLLTFAILYAQARRRPIGWRLDLAGLHECYRWRAPRLHPWDQMEHVLIDPSGMRILKLSGEVRVGRQVRRWTELVDELQRELWRRHGRTVPRVREIPTGAVSRAVNQVPQPDDRGLSRPPGEGGRGHGAGPDTTP